MENTKVDSPPSYNNVEMSAEQQKYSTPHGYPSQDARFENASQSVSLAYYPSAPVQQPVVVSMQPVGTLPYKPPTDNLGLSICSMFCCFVIGIFALLKAINSRDLYRFGNYAEAARSGQSAKKIAIAAIFVGCIVIVFNLVIVFIRASETGGQSQG